MGLDLYLWLVYRTFALPTEAKVITRPTTFVVGAGASKDYGLPTSGELRMAANNLTPKNTAYQLILRANLCTPEQLNKILDDLRSQGTTSIDEFLFARQDDEVTMKVGRALIALLLANHFHKVKLPNTLGLRLDWLGYIIGKMQSGAPDCEAFAQGNDKVRFVTFNFDSIIEDRLEKAIFDLYRGAAKARLQKTVEALHGQIIHVHGKLPLAPHPYPQFKLVNVSEWIHWLSHAPSQIRVVLDEIDENTLAVTQRAVKRSEALCFLGFAYAKDNLTRLGLPDALHRGMDGETIFRDIFGTAFGMRPGEKASVENRLAGVVELGDESERCLDFLRNHSIFKD